MIRETWGNKAYHGDSRMEVFFATGLSSNASVKKSLEEESWTYGDILQEDFTDDYKNLTYKAVGSLRWILENCRKTKFVLKADDDAFVNVFSLLKHLRDLDRTGQTTDILLCRLMLKNKIFRWGKWRITRDIYPYDRYPPYCSGLAFVLSLDVARALYEASYRTPVLWVDDAWLTGMVAANAKVKHIRTNPTYSLGWAGIEKRFLGIHWYQYLFGHLYEMQYFKPFWERLVAIAKSHTIPESDVIVPGQVFNNRNIK